jgi:hypothetical protein
MKDVGQPQQRIWFQEKCCFLEEQRLVRGCQAFSHKKDERNCGVGKSGALEWIAQVGGEAIDQPFLPLS